MTTTNTYPILYSLRNCPYAMRARIAIFKSKQTVQLRDLVLSNKPEEMLIVSPKGTVPVVVLADGRVIEESLDVMLWALTGSDPDNLLLTDSDEGLSDMLSLIHDFDHEFKVTLEAYKCAKRYKENNIVECREACEKFIQRLETRLSVSDETGKNESLIAGFLFGKKESLADIALLPFIRQFARIERQWYLQSPYPKVKHWLTQYLQSPMFTKVMAKYPLWLTNNEMVLFGDKNNY